ncbi:ABATE domain-containing protein [Lentzea atacamensis]|uniref:ABATE domain-containing protein n=1 Tax=Lentzea atacamensis TaxID=531938 RepID=UPI0011BEF57F|nr:ABATE domain-containing protein [Lentzea atacamensis]
MHGAGVVDPPGAVRLDPRVDAGRELLQLWFRGHGRQSTGRCLPAALSAVNDALTRVPTAPLLQWDEKNGPYRATPHPTTAIVDHALATLAADAADLLTGPDAERLTACQSSPCNRYLLRHGRRQWCSTRCGDRARAARAYARRAQPQD